MKAFKIIFLNDKQGQVRRPAAGEDLRAHDFRGANADPI